MSGTYELRYQVYATFAEQQKKIKVLEDRIARLESFYAPRIEDVTLPVVAVGTPP